MRTLSGYRGNEEDPLQPKENYLDNLCVRQAKTVRPFVISKEMISLALILLTLESACPGRV